ncbi:MAG: glycolate oxidase subunit GlcF [Methylococcaceae bacterium]|nr:glycolate oxidase subunit GlcF [Methylococcaceae bacterium]
MQTRLADFLKDSPQADEAQAILRSCVHCGFCNAACPTYRLLGDELDGPRGRIYLIKQLLEGEAATQDSRRHLDRCLTCRACESACPSGVEYHRLLDIGRDIAEKALVRPWRQRWLRRCLLAVLPYSRRVAGLATVGRYLGPFLPETIKTKLPGKQLPSAWPEPRHERRMLILEGCVQPALAPAINAATARVLDRLGISLIRVPAAGCCGALPHHLEARDAGLEMMRDLIDAWWPALEAGAEAIVVTASGCGVTIKEYGELLRDDVLYAEKAARVSASAKDIVEILQGEDLSALRPPPRKIAFQSPCTLQHGQSLDGAVESLLSGLGFELTVVADAQLCCGSAGTYSILQAEIAGRLRDAKLLALQAGGPELIATANIGCLLHLREKSALPIVHWIELLDGS